MWPFNLQTPAERTDQSYQKVNHVGERGFGIDSAITIAHAGVQHFDLRSIILRYIEFKLLSLPRKSVMSMTFSSEISGLVECQFSKCFSVEVFFIFCHRDKALESSSSSVG